MGKYYKIGIALSVVVFIVMFCITWIGGGAMFRDYKDEVEKNRDDYVTVRYYIDEECKTMVYMRVEKGTTRYELDQELVPNSESRIFLGLYDKDGVIYVDSAGQGLHSFDADTLLYPRFE